MPNIRYVCFSDLHLGEEDSLLTHVTAETGELAPNTTSPVLERLADCLAELLRHNEASAPKPTLILNGDILELALASSDLALKVLARFLTELMPAGGSLFGELIYIPGNHDHHLWEIARETQYRNYIRRLARIEDLEPAWHTTKVFMNMQAEDRLALTSLTEAARKVPHLDDFEFLTAYPNYGLLDPSGQDRRCVLFHHGHFIESAYRLMSTAASLVFKRHKVPEDIYALEGENFAWIDFFWSTMGRSGQVGEQVERLYEATSSRETLQRLTDSLARNLARRYDLLIPWSDWLEEQAFKHLFRHVVVKRVAGQQERQIGDTQGTEPLSKEGAEGLRWYLEGPLRGQMLQEVRRVPGAVTFVFGHTHKPFEQLADVKLAGHNVRLLNTGGWVVDSPAPHPAHGATAVLIDEELNAVNLRLFNQGEYSVRLQEALAPDEPHSALWNHVHSILGSSEQPWRAFAETAEREARLRFELFGKRLARRRGPGR